MALRDKLLDVLDRAAQIEQELIQALTPGERTQVGVVDHWSVKDLVSHATAWQQHMIQGLEGEQGWFSAQTVDDIDHTNAQIFEAYRDLTWDEVILYADQARGAIRRRVERSKESDLTDPSRIATSNDQPLWRRLVSNAVVHPVMHYAQFYADRGDRAKAVAIQERMGEMLLALDHDPIWQGVTRYNLGCAHALAGLKDQAIGELRQALELNPGLRDWSKQDSDLDSLRGDPAYEALYAKG